MSKIKIQVGKVFKITQNTHHCCHLGQYHLGLSKGVYLVRKIDSENHFVVIECIHHIIEKMLHPELKFGSGLGKFHISTIEHYAEEL